MKWLTYVMYLTEKTKTTEYWAGLFLTFQNKPNINIIKNDIM